MVLILADTVDETGKVLSQRIERECETREDAEAWLRENPHIIGHIVDKREFLRDVLETGTA